MLDVSGRTALGIAGLALGTAAYLIGPPPKALPDRLAKIPDDAVSIDNDIYEKGDFGWADEDHSLRLLNNARIPYFIDHARAKLGKGPLKLLDVGCGGGIAANEMAAAGFDVTGIDLSPASVKEAEKAAAARGLKVHYVAGSAFELPFEDGSFDVVLSSDVLEHLHDVPQALREISRVLRPGGVFVFDTINRTAFSWIFVIRLAQDLLRYVPDAAHDWRLFVTPAELRSALGEVGLTPCPMSEMRGMGPGPCLNPLEVVRKLPKLGVGAFFGPWRQTSFMGGSFLGYATKKA